MPGSRTSHDRPDAQPSEDLQVHAQQLERTVARQKELIEHAQARLVENEKLAAVTRLVSCVVNEAEAPIGLSLNAAHHLGKLTDEIGAAYRDGLMKRSSFEDYLLAAQDCAQLLSRNLQRAADLMAGMRGTVAGRDEPPRRLWLREFLDDTLLNLRPRLRERHLTARLHCPDDLVVLAEPGTLYRILSNLVGNAIQHAFKGMLIGEVEINATQRADLVELSVADNGVGIAPDVVGQVFEPFFTTARDAGGMGLGLHVVYSLVTQNLAGTVECNSRPGRGTVFTLRFPTRKEADHDADARQHPRTRP